MQAFTQSFGSDQLDASALLMPTLGFLPATDPRSASTVEAIRRDVTEDGLVRRYQPRTDGLVDGIESGEGVFLACSFWLADALALQGRLNEACELFERLLDLRNDVGLLAEEYDPPRTDSLATSPRPSLTSPSSTPPSSSGVAAGGDMPFEASVRPRGRRLDGLAMNRGQGELEESRGERTAQCGGWIVRVSTDREFRVRMRRPAFRRFCGRWASHALP